MTAPSSTDVAKLVRLRHRRRGCATRRRGRTSGCPCPLARIRAESAEQIIPFAATTEAAFAAVPSRTRQALTIAPEGAGR